MAQPSDPLTPAEALAFVVANGVVLASAKGPVPRMAQIIAREPVKDSWWGHARGKQIYAALTAISESPDVLVCRIVAGKVTFVHRRLWPALIRAADVLPHERLAQVDQVHTDVGHHVTIEVPFPQWADAASMAMAASMEPDEALR